jgi:hypothetical protein
MELGAEVFASDTEEQVFFHTCKSRPCSSCGYRATVQWQRERWAALPDVPYRGITFTMPDVLWPFFRDNPRLAKALSPLAANIIQARVNTRCGLRVGVIAILHTFNGKLEFNSHVHTMVTAGGMYGTSDTWISSAYHERNGLFEAWRRAVIKLLRAALVARQLLSELTPDQIEDLLARQEKRWWSVKIQSFKSKDHFLRYAGRYLRRPPIAQRRITYVGEKVVRFWYKDKKQKRKVTVQCSPQEFIERWIQHIPEQYQHAVRTFGLFAPQGLSRTSAAVFAVLGQECRSRPKPRRWAESIKRDFGRDPLLDSKGKRMTWVRRISPRVFR